eukprot:Pgem_evm2s12513
MIPKILNTKLFGISKIGDYLFQYNEEDERIDLQVEGCNLIQILNSEIFDNTTASCNNMWEIYNLLGIEATRQYLIEEFEKVLNSDGSITSISRYGTRNKESPLARASFEESLDNFLRAVIFTETDTGVSVSASVMLAKTSKTGTGFCGLKLQINHEKIFYGINNFKK